MTTMPTGQPRSVPDPEGELYDAEMAVLRRRREEAETGRTKIARPTVAQSFIPVVGPAWEAVADYQDGNYLGAAFNGAMAIADVLPIGITAKGVRAASKGIGVLKKGSVSANAAGKKIRGAGLAGKGQEIHHTIRLRGLSRTAQDPRNHYALLKVMPVEQHRRLTGSWKGAPRYDPVRRVWYGTTDWQKALPTAIAAELGDGAQNVTQKPRK